MVNLQSIKQRFEIIGNDVHLNRALEKAMEGDEKIPIGVLYENSERNVFGHRFREAVAERPLPELDPIDVTEIKGLLQKFGSETG